MDEVADLPDAEWKPGPRRTPEQRAKAIRKLIGRVTWALECDLPAMVATVYRERDWESLGYPGWESYVREEFGTALLKLDVVVRRQWSKRLRDEGRLSQREIAAVVNVSVGTTNADLREADPETRSELNTSRTDSLGRKQQTTRRKGGSEPAAPEPEQSGAAESAGSQPEPTARDLLDAKLLRDGEPGEPDDKAALELIKTAILAAVDACLCLDSKAGEEAERKQKVAFLARKTVREHDPLLRGAAMLDSIATDARLGAMLKKLQRMARDEGASKLRLVPRRRAETLAITAPPAQGLIKAPEAPPAPRSPLQALRRPGAAAPCHSPPRSVRPSEADHGTRFWGCAESAPSEA